MKVELREYDDLYLDNEQVGWVDSKGKLWMTSKIRSPERSEDLLILVVWWKQFIETKAARNAP